MTKLSKNCSGEPGPMGLLDSILADGETDTGATERVLPRHPHQVRGGDEPAVIYEALVRLGLLTNWRCAPDCLKNRQYHRVICYAADTESRSYSGLDKAVLQAVADHLNVNYGPRDSTRVLRKGIAKRAEFDYDTPSGQIRMYTKPELQAVAIECIRRRHREGWA